MDGFVLDLRFSSSSFFRPFGMPAAAGVLRFDSIRPQPNPARYSPYLDSHTSRPLPFPIAPFLLSPVRSTLCCLLPSHPPYTHAHIHKSKPNGQSLGNENHFLALPPPDFFPSVLVAAPPVCMCICVYGRVGSVSVVV